MAVTDLINRHILFSLLTLSAVMILTISAAMADITLYGYHHLGDQDLTGYTPYDPVRYEQLQTYPIHFYLTEEVTITEVTLNGINGLEDGHVEVFIDGISVGTGADGSNVVDIVDQTLTPGLHKIGFQGQCYLWGFPVTNCNFFLATQDDFFFESVTLSTLDSQAGTKAYNHTQKYHLGNWDENLWFWSDDDYKPTDYTPYYPDTPDGTQVTIDFTLDTNTTELQLDFYRLRALDTVATISLDGSIVASLIPGGDSVDLDDDPYSVILSQTVTAGSHTLTISTGYISGSNRDDFSWDELIIIPTAPTPELDHYEIWHDGSALTCQPEGITIRACDDASCSTLYTDTVSITLTPSGWVDGDTKTFSGGTATFQLRHTSNETVTLGIGSSNPNANYCCVNTANGSSSCTAGDYSECDITFYDSGFIFDVPDLVSCKEKHDIILKARKKDDETEKCIPAFGDDNSSRTIRFWASYINPSDGTQAVSINGTNIETSSGAGTGTPIVLQFNSDANATFSIKYPDAGQLELNALYSGSGDETGLEMSGQDTFVAKPYGFYVYTTDADWQAENNATSSVFKKSCEEFNISARAVCWEVDGDTDLSDNTVTGNYQANSVSLTHQLVEPSGGTNGVVNVSTLDFSNGTASNSTVTFSEVGIVKFSVTDTDYLGAGSINGTSANIGRFTPHHFTTEISDNGTFKEECVTFTYSGQKFQYQTVPEITVRAMSGGCGPNPVTQNYVGGFDKLSASDFSFSYPVEDSSQNGVNGSRLQLEYVNATGILTNDGNGILRYSFSTDDNITYHRSDNAIVAPFVTDVDITLDSVIDSDGVSANDTARTISPAGIEIRYGRLDIYNNYGPETDNMTMDVATIFWDGTLWSINEADICTDLDPDGNDFELFNWQENLDPGETSIISNSVNGIDNGEGNFTLLAPGTGNDGSVEIRLKVTAPFYDWLNGGGNGTAYFGLFRGNDKIIHWYELY